MVARIPPLEPAGARSAVREFPFVRERAGARSGHLVWEDPNLRESRTGLMAGRSGSTVKVSNL